MKVQMCKELLCTVYVSGFVLMQAPYLVYMEVVECDNVTTAPLPSKLLDTATIRCARSEDDLACYDSANRSPRTVELSVCNDMPLMEYDECEGWTLEDDDIIQVDSTIARCSCLRLF